MATFISSSLILWQVLLPCTSATRMTSVIVSSHQLNMDRGLNSLQPEGAHAQTMENQTAGTHLEPPCNQHPRHGPIIMETLQSCMLILDQAFEMACSQPQNTWNEAAFEALSKQLPERWVLGMDWSPQEIHVAQQYLKRWWSIEECTSNSKAVRPTNIFKKLSTWCEQLRSWTLLQKMLVPFVGQKEPCPFE
mmetsp:Transcript_11148/g.20915  ORF Transcript_11148/g.20915 Transcript_11148/m.20915 type:complete len:192 (+) Transcript_11148:95-670(+)